MSGLMLIGQPKIFLVALTFATLTAVPYAAFLLWLDRNEKEPAFLIVLAFLWGAMAATTLSIPTSLISTGLVAMVSNSPELGGIFAMSIAAPVFEELFKGAGVLAIAIAFRHEFDNILDGIIYGAIVGLGFAWFENILYYHSMGTEQGFSSMAELAVARGVYHGIAGHATFTALTGVGLGIARVQREGLVRWFWPLAGLSLGILSHFMWNTFAPIIAMPAPTQTIAYLVFIPIAVLLLQLPFVLLIACVLTFVWQHENSIIARSLADEDPDIVKPEDLTSLVPARARTARSLRRLFSQGPISWWRHRMVERALIDLAFAIWHHQAEEPDEPADSNLAVRRLRKRVLWARLATSSTGGT